MINLILLLYIVVLAPFVYVFFRFLLLPLKINFGPRQMPPKLARFVQLIYDVFNSMFSFSSQPKMHVFTIFILVTMLPCYGIYAYLLNFWFSWCFLPLNFLGTYDLYLNCKELLWVYELNPYDYYSLDLDYRRCIHSRLIHNVFSWRNKYYLMPTGTAVALALNPRNMEFRNNIFRNHVNVVDQIVNSPCPCTLHMYDNLLHSDWSWFRYPIIHHLPNSIEIFSNIDAFSYVVTCYFWWFIIVGIILFILFDCLRMLLRSIYHYVNIVADLFYVLGSVCFYCILFSRLHPVWLLPSVSLFAVIAHFLGVWFAFFKLHFIIQDAEDMEKLEQSLRPPKPPTEQEILMITLLVKVILPASRALRESWLSGALKERDRILPPNNLIPVHEITCLEDLINRSCQEFVLFWECLNTRSLRWYFKARYLGIQPTPEYIMELKEALFVLKHSDIFLLLAVIGHLNYLKERELKRINMYRGSSYIEKTPKIRIFVRIVIVIVLVANFFLYVYYAYVKLFKRW